MLLEAIERLKAAYKQVILVFSLIIVRWMMRRWTLSSESFWTPIFQQSRRHYQN